MTDAEVSDFVVAFAAAWAARDPAAFEALWHPEGVLHYPYVDRPVAGSEIGRLNAAHNEQTPDLVWQLLDWTWRGNVVIVEWQLTNMAGGKRVQWQGVDKFTLRDGRIMEEIVYSDTGPLRAMRKGETLEPMIRL